MPKLSSYLQKEVPEAKSSVWPQQSTPRLPVASQTPGQDAAQARLVEQFRAQHNRRLQDRGPRRYRLPDGSLAMSLPQANPFAVASRAVWHGLVTHCRSQGADPQCEAHGFSLRHNISVTYDKHMSYLEVAGLGPEQDPQGRFLGLDPQRMDPLADAAHPFKDPSSLWHQADERAVSRKHSPELGA